MCSAAEDATWQQLEEHWYTVEVEGTKVGWLSATLESDETRYRTTTETSMGFGRGMVTTTIELKSAFVETRDGRPLSLHFVQSMARQPVETKWRFEDDHVLQISRQGDRSIQTKVPPPEGTWLTPMAVHRLFRSRVDEGAQEITYRTIHGESGLEPVEVRHLYLEDGQYEIGGEPVGVTLWKTTTSHMPTLEALEKYTDDGVLVYEEISVPVLGKTVTRLTTKAEARAAGGEPELLVKTFVTPSRPIDNAHRATTATLRLRVGEGEMPDLPSAGAQRVTLNEDGSATVSIDIDDSRPAPATDPDGLLASSAIIDAQDPLIRALSAKAVRRAGDDPMARAEAARASVHQFLTEVGLDTVFGTASETARTRSGDCSEHAVLLCALLRADSIPARVAIGLTYADSFLGQRDIFGWHMWTQALIDGRWVDFDATLPKRYHAAHVLTNTSSLNDNVLGAELASTLMLMGNLQIDVIDVGYD